MQVVCEATQASDSKTRVAAYECLVKITSLYYAKLAAWMQNIFNVSYIQSFSIFPPSVFFLLSSPVLLKITLEAIRKDEPAVALQAVEFWSTVCDVEIDILMEIDEVCKTKNIFSLSLSPTQHHTRFLTFSFQCAAMKVQPTRQCQNFIKGAMKFLIPVLEEALTKQV